MTTALDMITDAFRIANVIDENETPSAEQGVAALRTLNQMVAQWIADGLGIPWHTIADLADDLPIDIKDERALKYALADELAGEYGLELLPKAQRTAAETKAALSKRYRKMIEMSLDHLPLEAGRVPERAYPE